MTFEVLTYNVREGGEDRLPIIADVLRNRRPDVIALLEANSRSNALTLARDLEMDLAFGTANNEYHVAWLSRHEILRSRNHRLVSLSKRCSRSRLPGRVLPCASSPPTWHPATTRRRPKETSRPYSACSHDPRTSVTCSWETSTLWVPATPSAPRRTE